MQGFRLWNAGVEPVECRGSACGMQGLSLWNAGVRLVECRGSACM
jgi:hypothetical protein